MSFVRFAVHCLTINGIPLFSKNVGEMPSISFPLIGSLNGIHMFGKNQGAELLSTSSESGIIYWKQFENIKFILIVAKDFCCAKYVEVLLNNVYKSMIMSIGETELTNQNSNIERLKKKMKLCIPLLDSMLEKQNLMSTFTQTTEILHVLNANILKNYLTSFTEDLDSEFGCITMNGKITIATDKFWQLQTIETALLSFVMNGQKNSTASDIPVYLPNGSPTVPHRLITIKLIDNVQVGVVCGPEPSLQDILKKYVVHYWSPLVPSLRECMRSIPRCYPPEIKLDDNILSVFLFNLNDGQCLLSLHTHGFNTGSDFEFLDDASNRYDALIKFFFTSNEIIQDSAEKSLPPTAVKGQSEVKEMYQCHSTHKCYMIRNPSYEIYALFTNQVPTYAMAHLTGATLKLLTKDR